MDKIANLVIKSRCPASSSFSPVPSPLVAALSVWSIFFLTFLYTHAHTQACTHVHTHTCVSSGLLFLRKTAPQWRFVLQPDSLWTVYPKTVRTCSYRSALVLNKGMIFSVTNIPNFVNHSPLLKLTLSLILHITHN